VLCAELLRKFDPGRQWHCGLGFDGLLPEQVEKHLLECTFRPVGCLNAGCHALFSARYADEHDAVCEHKVVACERGCGEQLCRFAMREHLDGSCGLKPVACPFLFVGCHAPLVQRDLAAHESAATCAHLAYISPISRVYLA